MSAALILKEGGLLAMSDIAEIVSMVGFPIAAYIAMFWYMIKQSESHKEEMDSIKEALNANTSALIELRHVLNRGVD